jgi:hypothetical protein
MEEIMTSLVIGRKNVLGVSKSTPRLNPLAAGATYVNPSSKSFYSRHGFALPLDFNCIPFSYIMDDKLTKLPSHVEMSERNMEFLLIDHRGTVSITGVAIATDAKMSLRQAFIDTDNESWWIAYNLDSDENSKNHLVGFLACDPPVKAVDNYCFKYRLAERLEWLSISGIVKTLNEEFPRAKPIHMLSDLAD